MDEGNGRPCGETGLTTDVTGAVLARVRETPFGPLTTVWALAKNSHYIRQTQPSIVQSFAENKIQESSRYSLSFNSKCARYLLNFEH